MLDKKIKEQAIINDYFNNLFPAKEIAKKYGFKTSKSIYDIILKHNLKPRDHQECKNIKKSYINFSMKAIDSYQKAYYLGLMLTDGYISLFQNKIGIDLCDKDAIEWLSEYINCSFLQINCQNHITKNNFNQQIKYRLTLFSKSLMKEFSRLSVIPNKSLNLLPPKLYKKEEKFLSYILRGIIDGDGWIRKDGKEFFICSSSENFIFWCKKELEKIGMQKLKITNIINEFNGAFILRTAIKENIKILKEKIYFEDFGMRRKYLLLNKEPSETIMETSI